jgi:hypothetical protein
MKPLIGGIGGLQPTETIQGVMIELHIEPKATPHGGKLRGLSFRGKPSDSPRTRCSVQHAWHYGQVKVQRQNFNPSTDLHAK